MAARTDLTEGPLGKNIIRLTLGMMIGMIGMVAFNLIDTYFVGQLGTTELAAMSFTFPVIMVANSIALGLGLGTSAVISRTIGSGDHDKVKKLTSNSLILGVLFVGIMMIIGFLTINPVFRMLGANEEMIILIRQYMTVWYIGVPFVVIPMMANNAMRAAGNTLIPSIVMMSSVLVNTVLDPLLIFGIGPFPRLELQGAAIATVIARMTTFIVALLMLRYKFDMLSFRIPHMDELIESWKKVLFIGIPAMINQFIPPISMGIVTRLVAGYGKEAIAGLGVSTRIEMFSLGPMMSLATVMIAFTGQNLGAQKFDRILKGAKFSNRTSLILGFFFFIVLSLFGRPIALFFNSDETVASVVVLYLSIVSVSYGSIGIAMSASSSFSALHKPYSAIFVNIVRMFVLLVPLALTGAYFAGLPGLFTGLCVSFLGGAYFSDMWLKKTLGKMAAGQAT
ncbi:MAG: MATE family efflux transporter [Candidatus Delongbacteria bacterium]|nr:MATE family efflux transporter [Candidatus Delongbacteria bacterium]